MDFNKKINTTLDKETVLNLPVLDIFLVQFDLMAASSDLHSVTSILFWDGPDRVVGEYDFGGAENWQEGICQCCYAIPFNQVMRFFLGITSNQIVIDLLHVTFVFPFQVA